MDEQLQHKGNTPPLPAPTPVTTEDLSVLVNLSPDALLVVDQAGRIVMINAQAATLFGSSSQELQGKPVERLLPAHQRTLHRAHREHYFREPQMRSMGTGLPLFGLRPDGSTFPLDISLRPVSLDGQLLSIAAVRDLSEQRRLERERDLQTNQLRLQAELLDLAHDAILVRDSLDRVTFWNKGAEHLYGWSSQQAQGRITHSLLHTRYPFDLQTIQVHLRREGNWQGELIHTCKDGRTVVVESRWAQICTPQGELIAIMEINRDITRRRQLEQQVQTAHKETVARLSFLQQVLDALPSSVYLVYGQEARLLLANGTAANVWGATWPPGLPMREFLNGQGIMLLDLQNFPLPPEQYATLRAVQQGETVLQQQEIIQRLNGSRLPVMVSALPLSTRPSTGQLVEMEQANEIVALVVHQDVSTLKEAEYLKDEFIAVATHELRNPLAALKGYADMLLYQTAHGKGATLSPWQRDALEEIGLATARLEKLTADLLDVTRLQAGRLALTPAPTDLVAVTQRMMQQAQISTQRHILSLHTPLSALIVEVDRTRIEQVLSNLLSNAIKYSPQGGPIELTLHEEEKHASILLTVRDHGIGIPTRQQERIFGRFMRADNARASEITGTGLGLYLSRELVEHHGGHLWFESVEGEGSTFFLRLPLP